MILRLASIIKGTDGKTLAGTKEDQICRRKILTAETEENKTKELKMRALRKQLQNRDLIRKSILTTKMERETGSSGIK